MNDEKGAKSKKPSSAIQGTLAVNLLLTYISVLVIIAILIVHVTRPKPTYFVNAQDGRIAEVFPLSEPNVTSSALTKWATLAATSAYTLNFSEADINLEKMKDFFTIDGYQQFMNALNDSGSLKKIIGDKLVQSAVATDTAVILQEGPLNGTYTWRIQLPLLVTYQGASTSSSQKTIAVSLLVIRVPTDLAPKGIGISQILDTDLHQ